MADDHEWDEFKLLQDKLDKVGDFRFRVKTWTTGIIGGLLLGGIAAKLPSYVYIFLALPIAAFWLLEKLQEEWQKAFERRLIELDSSLRRKKMIAFPLRIREWRSKRPQSISDAVEARANELKRRWFGRMILNANHWFYVAQFILILAVAVIAAFRREDAAPVTHVEVSTTQPFAISAPLGFALTQPAEFQVRTAGRVPTTQPASTEPVVGPNSAGISRAPILGAPTTLSATRPSTTQGTLNIRGGHP